MKRQIFLSVCCITVLISLQACSKNDEAVTLWSSVDKVYTAPIITSNKVSSNSRGDIVLVWEEVEEDVRVDQALTDAHDPQVPYPIDALISMDRDMNPDPEIFEAYDSANEAHRAAAKIADYINHEAHTHVDIFKRVSVKARVYSASSNSWRDTTTLHGGFWQKNQQGNRPLDDVNNEQLTITDNVLSVTGTNITASTHASGDAVVAWHQITESMDSAGDAGEGRDIYTAQYRASNTSWTAIEQLVLASVSEKPVSTEMAVSQNVSGNIQLLWIARNTDVAGLGGARVYQAAYDRVAATWSSSTLLSDAAASTDAVKIAMFNDTEGVAIWSRINSAAKATYVEQNGEGDLCVSTATICDVSQTNLYAHRFNSDGWVDSPLLISDALGEVGEFEIVTSESSVWVVWEQNDLFVTPGAANNYINSAASSAKIVATQLDTTAFTWAASSILNSSNEDGSFENNKSPAIAIDSSGTVVVTWSQEVPVAYDDENRSKWNNSQRESIWLNAYDSSWKGAQQLASDERVSFIQPSVVSTADDRFTFVWKGWSVSNTQSGYRLFSLDFNSAVESFSEIAEVNPVAANIDEFSFISTPSSGVKIFWASDQNTINTSSK